jgi:hypothetical protein
MLLIVILNATTDDTGASSPVAKTCPWVFGGGVDDEELLTPLQALKLRANASSPVSDRNLFMVAPVDQNLWGSGEFLIPE